MNTNADVLILTPRSLPSYGVGRTPLERFILPLSVLEGEIFFPQGAVWWLEYDSSRAWLRARGEVAYTSIQESLRENARQLVWDLVPSSAERISLPGISNRQVEVSDLIANILAKGRGVRVAPISIELERALQDRYLQIGESVWSFEWAHRHLMRLAEQLHLVSHLADLSGNLAAAWHFARANFVRNELVSLAGWDPFQVAAAVLAGLPKMPKEWCASAAVSEDNVVMRFGELDVDNIARIESVWEHNSSDSPFRDALEQSDKRHQQILKSLALSLRHLGFTPTYNRFVDLRVENPTTEFFCEIKTAHPENFLHQVRLAVGQLLEYRFRRQKQNGDQSLKLVAVVEHNAALQDIEFARQFLASLDIVLVLWHPETDEFEFLYSVFCSK